jgi:hypothetical protein
VKTATNVLSAGAGGGLDAFCGLAVYFLLNRAGKRVYLADFSFTEFGFRDGELLLAIEAFRAAFPKAVPGAISPC